jgi:hypothetical protein
MRSTSCGRKEELILEVKIEQEFGGIIRKCLEITF